MDQAQFDGLSAPGGVVLLPVVDSTNEECKRRAEQGAPAGLAVLAWEQTGGKGRRGRSFQSLPGKGLYLSLLLRPQVPPEQLPGLTPRAAVAVCQAVEDLTGLSPVIKWPNDVLLDGRKVCGILTELDGQGGSPYAVVGVGVNVSQTPADFGPELAPIAVSLAQMTAEPPALGAVAKGVLEALWRAYEGYPARQEEYLAKYRARCATVGRAVRLLRPQGEADAWALGIDDDFSLRLRLPDGSEEAVSTGEVSVRGLLGYG